MDRRTFEHRTRETSRPTATLFLQSTRARPRRVYPVGARPARRAGEAEAGYDADTLKRRGRGRPGRGAEPMQVVAVRLTAEELDALDAAAAEQDMSRSEAIRAALAHFAP